MMFGHLLASFTPPATPHIFSLFRECIWPVYVGTRLTYTNTKPTHAYHTLVDLLPVWGRAKNRLTAPYVYQKDDVEDKKLPE